MAVYVNKDGNLQTVAIGIKDIVTLIDNKVPVKITSTEKSNYDSASLKAHEHGNKNILDKFSYNTSTNQLIYDGTPVTALTRSQIEDIIHDEVPIILSSDDKINYDDAVNKKHEHKNKDFLDSLSYDSLNNRIMYNDVGIVGAGLLRPEVEAVIDEKVPIKLTEEEKEGYGLAYKCLHTHDNHEILDKFGYNEKVGLTYDGKSLDGVTYDDVVQIINEEVPVKLTEDQENYYNDSASKAHEHDNLYVLEGLGYDEENETLLYNGKKATGGFSQKEIETIIDNKVPIILSTEEYDDFNQAVDLSHSHANKSVLDLLSCEGKEVKFNGETIFTLSNAATSITEPDLEGVANASVTVSDQKLILTWTDPDNLTLNGKTATWKGTKVIMKAGSYPKSITDGTIVVDNQTKNKYQTNGFVISSLNNDTTYYFKFFTYSDTENVSTNVVRLNGTPYRPPEYKVMTVVIDDLDSDPEKALTYADDAIGMTPGADEWDNTLIFKDIRPCVLRDGEVLYYLDKNDYTKREDGSDADITTLGNDVMIEIPKLGYRLTHTNNVTKVSVTNNPDGEEDGFCYYAHTVFDSSLTANSSRETDLVVNEKIYVGAYIGTVNDSRLYSSSDKKITLAQIVNIQNRNENFGLFTYYQYLLLQCLYLIKYKDRNSRKIFTKLLSDVANTNNIITGKTNSMGMYNSDENIGNKFLGFENLFDVRTLLAGYYYSYYSDYYGYGYLYNLNMTHMYTGTSFSRCYLKPGYLTIPVGNNANGFQPISTSSIGGSDTTYYCAYIDMGTSSKNAYNCCIRGSSYGIFGLTYTSSSSNYSRLVYYPKSTNTQTTE